MASAGPVAMDDAYIDAADTSSNLIDEEVERFLHFTGAKPLKPNSVFILVMGTTGVGKSTFISQCIGKDVGVGHHLSSCTKDLAIFEMPLQGHNVYLIDTPGFDDTDRSDSDTLKLLAHYLSISYANRVYVGGIVYMHRISDNRLSGTTKRNIAMFKALCGSATYENVAIATTMWDVDDIEQNARKEAELLSRTDFFGDICADGARHFRHFARPWNDPIAARSSGVRILSHLITQSGLAPVVLQLQYEMVDETKPLDETEAGKVLLGDLARERAENVRHIQELRDEWKQAMQQGDRENARMLTQMRQAMEQSEAKAKAQSEALQRSLFELHKEEEMRLTKVLDTMEEQWRKKLDAKEQELTEAKAKLQNTKPKTSEPRHRNRRRPERCDQRPYWSSETLVEDRNEGDSSSKSDGQRHSRPVKQSADSPRVLALEKELAGLRREVQGKRRSTEKVRTAITAGLASGASTAAVTALITCGAFCIVC